MSVKEIQEAIKMTLLWGIWGHGNVHRTLLREKQVTNSLNKMQPLQNYINSYIEIHVSKYEIRNQWLFLDDGVFLMVFILYALVFL